MAKRNSIWKTSLSHLHDIRYLSLIAVFIAMKIVVGLIRIPVGENLRISITFIIVALEASITGPVCGMVSGAVTDTLSFIIFPDGAYFPGYTLTAMAGELIYALFLYQKKITVTRIGAAKICNNYLVNVCMGSLWSSILYDKAFIYYASVSIVKNTILLPFEITILVVVFNLLIPSLVKRKLIPFQNKITLK